MLHNARWGVEDPADKVAGFLCPAVESCESIARTIQLIVMYLGVLRVRMLITLTMHS